MAILSFDHVAVPTDRPEELIAFYGALGFSVPDVTAWRECGVPFFSIEFGKNKINVHCPAMWKTPDFDLRGPAALPGCGDFCFVWEGNAEELHNMLGRAGADIVAGPVELLGARGKGTSVYTRDPDSNLLEFIIYDS